MRNHVFQITAALLLNLITTLGSSAAQPETAPTTNSRTDAAEAELSVLERFRTHTGQRTPDDLIRLFYAPGAADTAQQKPRIVLSDGKTPVELTVAINVTDTTAPNFACIEARLISIKRTETGVWRLAVLPDAGSWKSALLIRKSGSSSTVGLTVAPPLPVNTDLGIKGFAAYLKNSETDLQQRIDLNGDGKADYQDDYILTANVLAAKNADPHDPATRNTRARELTPVRPKP